MKLRSLLLLILLLASSCFAATNSPVVMLDNTAKQLISELKSNRLRIKKNQEAVFNIVRRLLLPKVDVRAMSRSVLGRNNWKKASIRERVNFQKEFVKLVIRTYARAISKYRNETIQFFPVRGGYAGKRRIVVKSIINRSSGPKIPINYRLRYLHGKWLVYDFSVEGVSLIQSFRSQFRLQLKNGKLETLIAKLKTHNNRRKK